MCLTGREQTGSVSAAFTRRSRELSGIPHLQDPVPGKCEQNPRLFSQVRFTCARHTSQTRMFTFSECDIRGRQDSRQTPSRKLLIQRLHTCRTSPEGSAWTRTRDREERRLSSNSANITFTLDACARRDLSGTSSMYTRGGGRSRVTIPGP